MYFLKIDFYKYVRYIYSKLSASNKKYNNQDIKTLTSSCEKGANDAYLIYSFLSPSN
jgi:hypothetical protein